MAVRIACCFAVLMLAAALGDAPKAAVAGGGGCHGRSSTESSGDSVKITNGTCFTPTVLHVEAGTTVTWTNTTAETHDVAGATLEWGNYNELRNGDSTQFRFDAPGTYPYYCFLHPGMTGAIVVGDGRRSADSPAVQPVSVVRPLPASSSAAPAPAAGAATAAPVSSPHSNNWLVFWLLGVLFGAVAMGVVFAAGKARG